MCPQSPRLTAMLFAALFCMLVPSLQAAPPVGYYDTADPSSSVALRSSLHAIIDDHVRYPYTSTATDTWDILELADEDPNNPSNILDVYRNASYAKQGRGNTLYNREHTWPSSYGFPNDNSQNYPYTDCHHLFLVDDGYNSSRSNKPYRYCNSLCSENPTLLNNGQGGGSGAYPGNSNWTEGSFTQGTWETWIGRRGDVARALFYLDIRYEGGTHGGTGASEPDLILTDTESLIDASNTGANESVAYMGMLSVLLQWHVEDPVDEVERSRNDVVFSFQGNRNPFVDHPEWVGCVFNGVCGGCSVAAECDDLDACTMDSCVGGTCFNDPVNCDDGLFCNGLESCLGGVCQAGSDPCPSQSCDETADTCVSTGGGDPWINEFHYDNVSTDTGEFIEVAGPAGLDLSGWQLIGYNGSGGTAYASVNLSGVIPNQQGCMGTLSFAFVGLQNGSPDGIALVDNLGQVVQFISYEGVLTGVGGPADGMISVDVGVEESNSTTLVGESLQLTGSGASPADFTWQAPAAESPGLPNAGQTLTGCAPGCTVAADCDDGTACTVDDCIGGMCSNTAASCDDLSACTLDSCDPVSGCVYTPLSCDDGSVCTTDGCDVVTGCYHNPIVCDDGNACTTDSCDSLNGCVATPVTCDDADACTADGCDVVTGCYFDPIACNDGDVCTVDSCDPLSGCVTAPVTCDDSNACTADACDAVNGCVYISISCDDANLCTIDGCDVATGCYHDAVICSDGNACTTDSCDAATGLCVYSPVSPCCGNTLCEAGETQCSCPADCGAPPAGEAGLCGDGVDNDCDGLADCNDVDCNGDPACPSCVPAGGACTAHADCCSNSCHRRWRYCR